MPEYIVQPLADAVERIGANTPVGSVLTSDEWADVPLALRERAFVSARVEFARLLGEMQRQLGRRIGMLRERVARGTTMISRDSFLSDIRSLAEDLGLREPGRGGAGGLQDIGSNRRLGLVYDFQTQQAAEFARWKMDQDPDVLDAYPAQELVRIESRREPRDWRALWSAAGGPMPGGRMVALKSSPIWAAISRFGTPFPPFDFGSGMGLEEIDRAEAEALGLIGPGEVPTPAEAGFNDALQASVRNLSPEMQTALQDSFGEQVEIVDGVATWRAVA